ncbi:MAG: DUF1080 domain-containing protein, partial [Phycisphaerae bacterium]|nr:DUF1080 domain-containing protein [Phycisphaerae bacterium]
LVKSGVVSPLGQAYSVLANGFPNDIIPVPPYVPDPTPALFADDFSSGTIAHPWTIKAGKWAVENEYLRQSRVDYPWAGETLALQHTYTDFNATFRMRVNNAVDSNHWAGLLFHAASRFHHHSHSGYLVFMRRNGAIGLHNNTDGTMQEVAGAVADATQWQNIRVQMAGWRIQVWVNDALIIDRTDANHRFSQGYTLLQVNKTDSSFDDVKIWNSPDAEPVVAGSTISATRLIADDVTPYTVSVTAEDADGVADIVDMRILLHDGTYGADYARGYLAWGMTDEDITRDGGEWTLMGDAAGGGRWAWRLDDWGSDTYISPQSASMNVNGNQRIVTFGFTVKPAWAPAKNQRLRGRVRDARGGISDWLLSPDVYQIARSAPGDLDADRHVDQTDFGLLQACLTGPGMSQNSPACQDAKLDNDDDVDQDDIAIFRACLTGPGIPADPACAD